MLSHVGHTGSFCTFLGFFLVSNVSFVFVSLPLYPDVLSLRHFFPQWVPGRALLEPGLQPPSIFGQAFMFFNFWLCIVNSPNESSLWGVSWKFFFIERLLVFFFTSFPYPLTLSVRHVVFQRAEADDSEVFDGLFFLPTHPSRSSADLFSPPPGFSSFFPLFPYCATFLGALLLSWSLLV